MLKCSNYTVKRVTAANNSLLIHTMLLYTHSGLVMIQTTNGIFNKTLYDLSTPKALLAWHRVRLANWLASSGEEWANYVSQYNSGTHIQKLK
jgi:hypothetical protein